MKENPSALAGTREPHAREGSSLDHAWVQSRAHDEDKPMTEDAQQHVLQLAEGLRAARTTLDASRAQGLGNESERRRLAREVDILSHLVWANHTNPRDDLASGEPGTLREDDDDSF